MLALPWNRLPGSYVALSRTSLAELLGAVGRTHGIQVVEVRRPVHVGPVPRGVRPQRLGHRPHPRALGREHLGDRADTDDERREARRATATEGRLVLAARLYAPSSR